MLEAEWMNKGKMVLHAKVLDWAWCRNDGSSYTLTWLQQAPAPLIKFLNIEFLPSTASVEVHTDYWDLENTLIEPVINHVA